MFPLVKNREAEMASVALVSSSGDVARIPRGLLVSTSPSLAGVLGGCASPVLLMPDVTPKQMAKLLRHLKGEVLHEADEEVSDIACRYDIALPSANSEVPLPLKKRHVDFTPPPSPESQASLQEDARTAPQDLQEDARATPSPRPEERRSPTLPEGLLVNGGSTPSPPPEERHSPRAPTPLEGFLGYGTATPSPPPGEHHSPCAPTTPVCSPSFPQASSASPPFLPALSLLPYMLARGLAPSPSPPAFHGLHHFLPYSAAHRLTAPAAGYQTQGPAVVGHQSPAGAPRFPAEGSRVYVACEDCGKEILATSIHTHRRRHHRQLQEPVLCCGERFPTRWHLSVHRRAAHSRASQLHGGSHAQGTVARSPDQTFSVAR